VSNQRVRRRWVAIPATLPCPGLGRSRNEARLWEDVPSTYEVAVGEPASLCVIYRAGEVPNALRNMTTKLLAHS
jgi:hypothetical protein